MNRTHLIAALSVLTAMPAMAAVKVGDPAPPLSAGSWYNLPTGVRSLAPNHLKGQIVMVEFWATW